ncbi:hypothetical protein SBDP2_380018 [Syntrophobacter sp. SbD2]|nr:hypothetical protein SBDP2_380018 [Syntrophobacter sp. SbD2]
MKPGSAIVTGETPKVAPRAGAWIETDTLEIMNYKPSRPPRGGVD